MPIYTLDNNSNDFNPVKTTSFKEEFVLERSHLQQALKKNIEVIAEDCLIIAEEYAEWDGSKKRIDLLAIDKNANLVIIELKRTDSGDHMELQAIRYASMVSTMTLEIAVDIFCRYKRVNGDQEFDRGDALDLMSSFVNIELSENTFADDVRIILVSSNFSKELTTSVIWLNERNLNITCIRMQPYSYNSQILVDVQQIIPLPEAKDYQIRAQKKVEERREAKSLNSKDYSKYIFKGETYNKRYLALEIIKTRFNELSVKSFDCLYSEFKDFEWVDKLFINIKEVDEKKEVRYFLEEENQLRMTNGDVYVITNQWGRENIYKLINIATNFDYEIINKSQDNVVRTMKIGEYLIQQLEDKTILVFENDLKVSAYGVLKELALLNGVSLLNKSNGKKNTRQLGSDVLDRLI